MLACRSGAADCVRLLLEAGADPTLFDGLQQRTCLHYAGSWLRGCRLASALGRAGVSPARPWGQPPLWVQCPAPLRRCMAGQRRQAGRAVQRMRVLRLMLPSSPLLRSAARLGRGDRSIGGRRICCACSRRAHAAAARGHHCRQPGAPPVGCAAPADPPPPPPCLDRALPAFLPAFPVAVLAGE